MDDDGILGLVELLRTAGLSVPVGNLITFTEAVAITGGDLRSLYWSGRATLTHSPIDIELYDRVFRHWILGTELGLTEAVSRSPEPLLVDDDESLDDEQADRADVETNDGTVLRFSRTETLRSMDFADLDDEERLEVDRLIADMRLTATMRRSRRRRPSKRSSGVPDLRRTVRESLRTGGEPINRRTLQRTRVARRVVIIADISGSMAAYSRSLIRYAHAAVSARSRVEAFALGTRLTRLTRELDIRDPDQALQRAADSVEDWSGGTRLGEGLQQFNDDWGTRGMARGAVVVILSDGWDRGEPERLASEMARLSRVAHRIVWVNPLKASDGYAPLARGMAAALPYVDDFIEGHSLGALDRLSSILSSGSSGPVRSRSASTPEEVTR
ncbi:MAG: VWA domain-containing protein [Actinobacteria bacterium]|nr:VWA domain-containing protein [Actinomycetota bacterium]